MGCCGSRSFGPCPIVRVGLFSLVGGSGGSVVGRSGVGPLFSFCADELCLLNALLGLQGPDRVVDLEILTPSGAFAEHFHPGLCSLPREPGAPQQLRSLGESAGVSADSRP